MQPTYQRSRSVVILPALCLFIAMACASSDEGGVPSEGEGATSGAARIVELHPDKARYSPGDIVTLTVRVEASGAEPFSGLVRIEIWQIDEVIHEEQLFVTAQPAEPVTREVLWTPPANDFTGYLVVARAGDGEERSTAVDVSSTPFRFPRYGYISEFLPELTPGECLDRISTLAQQYHVNLLQFYDWAWRHEQLIQREPDGSISEVWSDLFGRANSWPVILELIDAAHAFNVGAMGYVMIYAAREGYAERWPIDPEWGVFATPLAMNQLNTTFFNEAALYLFDPSNEAWQDWIIDQYIEAIELAGFDGLHIDQLGPRYDVYTFDGRPLDLPSTFPVFLEEVERRLNENDPQRSACTFNIVDGEVDGWGVQEVATSPACDFLYSEIWYETNTYDDLRRYIEHLRGLGGGRAVVLAGYAQYAEQVGPIREAEDAAVLEGVEIDNDQPNFTGTGFVDAFDASGDSISWTVELPEDAPVTFVVRAANASGEVATRTLYIDGTPVGQLFFSAHDQWSTWSSDAWIQRDLLAGSYTIRLSFDEGDRGAINVDHLRLGEFDEDSVRLENAAMFASGAFHIQLGDEVTLLASEYYPNRSKCPTPSLQRALRRYYTFITAYENLLFDGDVEPVDDAIPRLALDGARLIASGNDGVWPVVRRAPTYDMVHLINLVGVDNDLWRDQSPTPTFLDQGFTLRYYADDPGSLSSAYLASPDFDHGVPTSLEMQRGEDERGPYVSVTIPRLEYWDLIFFARSGE